MVARALIEAYEALYWILRASGYDSERADQGAVWLSALGAVTGIWLGVEVAISLTQF